MQFIFDAWQERVKKGKALYSITNMQKETCKHTSVYDKRDDFGFPIVNFPWLSGDVPRLPSYGIYISQ